MQTNADDSFRDLIQLQDAIGEISEEVEKARYILQDLVEDFLDTVCTTPKKQAERFLYEWPRARAKGHILTDIFFRIQTILTEAEKAPTNQEEDKAV